MPPGIRKLYYTIREVAERTDLEPHVLRYWESQFELLHPKKNRAGNRVYTEKDVELVERIRDLTKRDKYTIDGARQVLEREARLDETERDLHAELRRLREFLEALRDDLPTS
ncbi:MAG TPA: MerR family transcriptional regulator [Bacteroidetes bacterium]|nr:MerR family transcriptional regulator [Bacteroidota bacterium]